VPLVKDLADTSALIVGGTAGIGYASAKKLVEAGVPRIVIAGRTVERGEAAAQALGDSVSYIKCDAADPAQVGALVAEAAGRMGGIDLLLSCGGGDPMPSLLHKIAPEDLIPTINGIQAPILHPAHAVLPIMTEQGGGTVLCIASDAGKLATPGESAIGAAMASIAMFCRTMAVEAKRNGIRVNCLTPSIVQGTPLYDKLMAHDFASKLFGKAEKMAALGIVTPEDIAEMVVFLAGPASAKTTGQTISITGGISAI
jgi:NAD(P)-dependent dehydrogenase (short-subunit alcohol dehydrogenase family)